MSSKKPNPFQKFRNNNKRHSVSKFRHDGEKHRRFFFNAQGYGRKGHFGRGTTILEEEFTYFMGIIETQQRIRNIKLQEKVAMANNVMQETIGKEIHLASNQICSKVLENCMPFVDGEHLERFFQTFGDELRPICSDTYASHVLNQLMETAFIRAVAQSVITDEGATNPKKPKFEDDTDLKFNMTTEFVDEHRKSCSAFLLRVSKFLLNNMEEFMEDPNANHLIRTAILSLAGIYIPKMTYIKGKLVPNADRHTGSKINHRVGKFTLSETVFKVSSEYLELLKEFPERLQMWPQFKDLPYKYRGSGLLQIICIALHFTDPKALDAFGAKLVKDSFIDVEIPDSPHDQEDRKKNQENGTGDDEPNPEADNDDDEEEENGEDAAVAANNDEDDDDEEKPSVFKSDSSIRLLQTLIPVASPALMTKITKLFNGRFNSLSKGKPSFFAVERLINYIADKETFENIFEELCPLFDHCLKTNRCTLISSISATCLRLKTKQSAFIAALQNCLQCNGSAGDERSKSFFFCVARLQPFDLLAYDKRNYVSIYGSLIAQDILLFNKPIAFVNAILEMPVKDLCHILDLPHGNYIFEKFLRSPTIGEKSREKLIKYFEGLYVDLAISRNGSRVLEELFKLANDAQKVVIAKELSGRDNKLKGYQPGRVVYFNLKLELFESDPEKWKAVLSGAEPEPEPASKKNKKPRKDSVEPMDTSETAKPSPKSGKKNKKNKRPAS